MVPGGAAEFGLDPVKTHWKGSLAGDFVLDGRFAVVQVGVQSTEKDCRVFADEIFEMARVISLGHYKWAEELPGRMAGV